MSEYAKGAKGLGVNCSAGVDRGGFFGFSLCSRWARIERNGKPYCKQHDPVVVKAKQAEGNAKWEREWAQKKAEHERRRAEHERRRLEAAYCKDLTDDDLRKGIGEE